MNSLFLTSIAAMTASMVGALTTLFAWLRQRVVERKLESQVQVVEHKLKLQDRSLRTSLTIATSGGQELKFSLSPDASDEEVSETIVRALRRAHEEDRPNAPTDE